MGEPDRTEIASHIDFSLDQFEAWVSERKLELAEHGLIQILDHLRLEFPIYGGRLRISGREEVIQNAPGLKPFTETRVFNDRLELYRRLASAISVFFSDASYLPANNALRAYLTYKNQIREIFCLGGYPNLDHILVQHGLLKSGEGLQLSANRSDFIRFLMCYTLDSGVNVNFRLFFKWNPQVATWAYLGLLTSCHRVLDRRSEEVRDYLLSIHDVLNEAVVDEGIVQTTPNPWMLCTYSGYPQRHELKRSLNRMLERWLEGRIPRGLIKRAQRNCEQGGRQRGGKPVAVVCGEVLRSNHAMFRNYAQAFERLRRRYYTVLVADAGAYDAVTAEAFDEVVTVSIEVAHVHDTVRRILSLHPSVIYYPSLGMAAWTVAICNLRLARLQVMQGGHPASSMSRHIDFFLAAKWETTSELDPSLFSETLLLTLRREPVRQVQEILAAHPDTVQVEVPERSNDGVCRLAVNSSLMKLSPKFLEVCQIIASHSTVPIEFHFFIAERGIRADSTLFSLQHMLPNSFVYSLLPYRQYMSALAQCDLALGTFPFGGATTNTDLLYLGIPKVIMLEGMDLSGHTDYLFWRRLNLDTMFFAENELGYLASVIYAIHNPSMLKSESARLTSIVKGKVQLEESAWLSVDGSVTGSPFAQRLAQAIKNHEALLEAATDVGPDGGMVGENIYVPGPRRSRWEYMEEIAAERWHSGEMIHPSRNLVSEVHDNG